MSSTLKLNDDTWIVRQAIAGPNIYCLSLVFTNTNDPGHVSHCACGVMATTREQATIIAQEQTAAQFPATDGWVLLGIAVSRFILNDKSHED